MYGCLNSECCDEVATFIAGQFNLITVALLVMIIFLGMFLVNQWYLIKFT